MASGSLMPDPKMAKALTRSSKAVTPLGEIEPEAITFFRRLLQTQQATPDGTVTVLREEFSEIQSTAKYLVPDGKRWDLILLMRARGLEISEIAEATDLAYSELLYWFHTAGIVRDLWRVYEAERWERLKTKMHHRAVAALDNPSVGAAEAMAVARILIDAFRREHFTVEDEDPTELLETLNRATMPDVKE